MADASPMGNAIPQNPAEELAAQQQAEAILNGRDAVEQTVASLDAQEMMQRIMHRGRG